MILKACSLATFCLTGGRLRFNGSRCVVRGRQAEIKKTLGAEGLAVTHGSYQEGGEKDGGEAGSTDAALQ
eukprot:6214678-Pleurochrysis_carterae.AAC.5